MASDQSYHIVQLPGEDDGAAAIQAGSQTHKRVYQACIPCRRRKVKCDLGSVDNPSDPPCQRCRRESKECYFSTTRRKRKVPGEGQSDEEEDDYIARNGRKKVRSRDSSQDHTFRRQYDSGRPSAGIHSDPAYSIQGPLTPGGHVGRTQPLRRPNGSSEMSRKDQKQVDDSNTQYENPEAQTTLRREVYGPHDALELLYKAATNNPDHKRVKSDATQHSPINAGLKSPFMPHPLPSPGQQQGSRRQMGPPDFRADARIDPTLTSNTIDGEDSRTLDPGYKAAIKAWQRFRFVRAGWFTPAEAVAYIDYYYAFLSPLTPISPPTFREPSTHSTLLMEEPILTVTLLTIASRYRMMPGPGGQSRSNAIHEQLWTYLRGMIERCLWGQEAFGGGFCGSGATEFDQTSSTAPWRGLRKGSLRTLGTIESLMILTEWHPRALHFPPAEATDELMLPSYEQPDNYSTDEDGNHKVVGGVVGGGKRIESWLEPAWRSDRMCWMLLSNAMGLSYELGVFDRIDELKAPTGDMARPEYEDEAYRLRAARIKKLVLIYISQLAGRLGWTNMVPAEHIETDLSFQQRRRKSVDLGNTPGTNTTISGGFTYIPDLDLDDQIIHCWAGITNAMRIGNERLFKSRKHTTDIIQNGQYVEELKSFQPILQKWQEAFSKCKLPQYIRYILVIEYEYVRIYVNSLSLQAVVERSTNNTGPGAGQSVNGGNSMADLSPDAQNRYGMLPLSRLGGFGPADQEYIKEVVQGSRNLLRTVVEGLLPNDYLKHAPVRTYFRIISGAMFLLKTFALGASKRDVSISIGLMDKAVDALRNCVVDDVHLGIRFADLLETLTSRLRSRFIQGPQDIQGKNQLSSGNRSPLPPQDTSIIVDSRVVHQPWGPAPNYQDTNIPDISGSAPATPFDLSQNGYYGSSGAPYSGGPSQGIYDMNDPNFGGTDWNLPGQDMWYLPTGPAFFQNSDQGVVQSAEGVQVSGMDLLDYMMGDLPGMDGQGPSATF